MANDTATVTQTVNTISVDESSQNTLTISSNAGGSLTVSDSTPSPTSVTVTPVSSTLNLESNFSPKESPIFSGSPTAPTPPSGDNSTRLATTAFVNSSVSLENTLSEIWNGPKMTAVRKGFLDNNPSNVCKSCIENSQSNLFKS